MDYWPGWFDYSLDVQYALIGAQARRMQRTPTKPPRSTRASPASG
jgi:hypothetical protein